MLKTTLWRPDTCGCEVEYQWDTGQPLDTRVHTPSGVWVLCSAHLPFNLDSEPIAGADRAKKMTDPAHVAWRAKAAAPVVEQLWKENRTVNRARSALEKQGRPPEDLDFTFTGAGVGRQLSVSAKNLTPGQRQALTRLAQDEAEIPTTVG
jgi:hypothetical protein